MRKIIAFLGTVILTGVLSFVIGWHLGVLRFSKADIAVTIPVHNTVHEAIRTGNTNRAMTVTGMVLAGKLGRYRSLSNNIVFRLTYGKKLLESTNFQKTLNTADRIVASHRTNITLVTTNILNNE